MRPLLLQNTGSGSTGSLEFLLGIHYFMIHTGGGYTECTGLEVRHNSVFCGGRNGRDWKLLTQIAERMPDTIFNFAMPQQCFEEYKRHVLEKM